MWSVNPVPTWPTHRSFVAVVGAHEERPEGRPAAALSGREPEDHAVLRVEDLDLAPGVGAPAGEVRGPEPLRDDPFQTLCLRRLDERRALPFDVRGHLEPVVLLHDVAQQLPALLQREAGRLLPIEPEEIEDHERHGDPPADALDLPRVREVHPLLQDLERVLAVVVERHDLAVEHGVHLVHQLVDHVDLGVLAGHVAARPRAEHRLAGGHLHEAPDAVHLRFEPPVGVVERLPASLREHRLVPRRDAMSGAVLVRREEAEPVGPRLHEVELEARVAAAVEPEGDLRVGPLDRLVPAVVEDPDLARAVVPLGDGALERSRTRAGGPRSARRAACRPSASADPSAPPRTAGRRPSRGARRSAGGWRRCLWITKELPVPTSSPGAGSVVPSSPNSRRRTYSTEVGSFDASAISAEDFPAVAGAAVRERARGVRLHLDAERLHGRREVLPRDRRTPAQRSPTRSKRSQTLSIRKSCGSKPPASTSSHVSGVETGARGSGRSE